VLDVQRIIVSRAEQSLDLAQPGQAEGGRKTKCEELAWVVKIESLALTD
jgi:hypothetical protein